METHANLTKSTTDVDQAVTSELDAMATPVYVATQENSIKFKQALFI